MAPEAQPGSPARPIAAASAAWRDGQLALVNALKIGGSLVATWSVALAVRFVLPRHLGPEQYGLYNFTEAFAVAFFVAAHLGIETYVQKEVPVRPGHASDFVGGVLALRAVLSLSLVAAMAAVLELGGRPPEVRALVFAFAAGQLLFHCNATFSALLHASGTVDGLSVANVLTKLLWGAAVLLALATRAGLLGLAVAFALAEAVKSAVLFALCRRHLRLELRLDAAATRRVLACSLPFFVVTITTTLFGRLGSMLMGFSAGDAEVGWFGLAWNLAQLALLMTPLFGSVLLPLFARVRARSRDELDEVVRRSLEVILMVAVPAGLALGLGADVWVRLIGGHEYAPAVAALRVLSPMFVLTYVAMVCAQLLYLDGRSWRVTGICLCGLVVNVSLNATLIPALAAGGAGGAGVGAALATIGTEAFTCGVFLAAIGRRIADARLASTALRLAGSAAAVIVLDRACAALGPPRLLLDAAAWCALAAMTGAIRIDEIRRFVATARVRQPTAAAPAAQPPACRETGAP